MWFDVTGWVMVMATPAALLYISRCGLPACFPWLRILYTIGRRLGSWAHRDYKRALYGNGDSPTSADLNGSFGNSMNNRRWYFLRLAVGNACEYVKDPSRLPIRVPQSKTVLYHWRSWRKKLRNQKKNLFFLRFEKKLDIFFFQI